MYTRLILIVFLVSSPLLFSDCAATRQANQLAFHLDKLTKAAYGDMSAEAKMDVLAQSFVNMMHESLNILNPKKGVGYVQQYGSQNKEPIEKIFDDIGEWQKSLSVVEKIALAVRIAQKPYVKDLVNLIPRFKNKYEQVKFVMDMTGKLKNSLIGLGAKQLNL